jgi:hypothetical protein
VVVPAEHHLPPLGREHGEVAQGQLAPGRLVRRDARDQGVRGNPDEIRQPALGQAAQQRDHRPFLGVQHDRCRAQAPAGAHLVHRVEQVLPAGPVPLAVR